jgi:hypothetical protein
LLSRPKKQDPGVLVGVIVLFVDLVHLAAKSQNKSTVYAPGTGIHNTSIGTY